MGAIRLECSRDVQLEFERTPALIEKMKAEVDSVLRADIRRRLEPGVREELCAQIVREVERKLIAHALDKNKSALEAKLKELKKENKSQFAQRATQIRQHCEDEYKRALNGAVAEKESHLRRIAAGAYEQDTGEADNAIHAVSDQRFKSELEKIEAERVELIKQKAMHFKKLEKLQKAQKQFEREAQLKELGFRKQEIELDALGSDSDLPHTRRSALTPVKMTNRSDDLVALTSPNPAGNAATEERRMEAVPASEGAHTRPSWRKEVLLPYSKEMVEKAVGDVNFGGDEFKLRTEAKGSPAKGHEFLISNQKDIDEFVDY